VAKALKAKGAGVRIVKGRQIVLTMPYDRLEDIASTEGVAKVDVGPRTLLKTDNNRRVTQAAACNAGTAPQLPQAYTGKGVIVGIVDQGFDLTHPMFKDKDGNLRIKGFYMPGNTTLGGDSVRIDGETLTGSYYSKPEDLLDTLRARGLEEISHGTHCISIAAGSIMDSVKGISGEPLGGIAPEADILICDIASDDTHHGQVWDDGNDLIPLNISESLQFMQDQAAQQQKPLVVSMSINSHDGWHDGTSNMATLLGDFCKDNNLALMLCAGNEGEENNYVNQTFASRDTLHLGVYSIDAEAYAFCCLPTEKKLKVEISIYDAEASKVLYTVPTKLESDNGDYQEFYYELPVEDEKDLSLRERVMLRHLKQYIKEGIIDIVCYKTFSYDQEGNVFDCTCIEFYHDGLVWDNDDVSKNPKDLCFMLHLVPSEKTEIHAWGDPCMHFSRLNHGKLKYGRNDMSMGDWNTSGEPVTVGAWTANNKVVYDDVEYEDSSDAIGDISWFSSYGTDRAGHKHPDVCAPGYDVAAALNSFDPSAENYGVYARKEYTDQFVGQSSAREYVWGWMSGTSMSTPAAAGVVALWMQAAADLGKTLNTRDIKDIIAHSCDTDEATAKDADRFGYGKINAYKGLLYVLGLETAIEGLSQNQPENVTFRVAGDLLYADGAEDGTDVSLYNLSGICVRQSTIQGGAVSLTGLQQGVYAVQIGSLGSTLIRK
jgi:subtilisin family serine protease